MHLQDRLQVVFLYIVIMEDVETLNIKKLENLVHIVLNVKVLIVIMVNVKVHIMIVVLLIYVKLTNGVVKLDLFGVVLHPMNIQVVINNFNKIIIKITFFRKIEFIFIIKSNWE
jgi:hypothetical protein